MRSFSAAQLALLKSPNPKMRLLATFFLDTGTYYFCDDIFPHSDGINTYIGASSIAGATDIKSSSPYAAESTTITIDGTRCYQNGISDPAALFQSILTYALPNRRISLAWGFCYPNQTTFSIIIPVFTGKINTAKLTDESTQFSALTQQAKSRPNSKLTIELDSLAIRYQNNTNRLRSQQDQLEIDPTDNFFAFVGDTIANVHNLYWGRSTPKGSQSGFGGLSPISGAATYSALGGQGIATLSPGSLH